MAEGDDKKSNVISLFGKNTTRAGGVEGSSAGNDDKFAKVAKLLKEVAPTAKPKRAKAKPAYNPDFVIVGDGNIQAGRDVHINKKETIRNEIKPGPEHITAAQARKLQQTVEKAVDTEVAAGGDKQQLFGKWWSILKNQYGVNSYLLIPAELGEHALSWLKQQIAIMRPKLRRNDNSTWRNDHYKAIWAKSRSLGMSKGEVYALVEERLGVKVVSLTKLGEQNLKKLYNIIMAR